MKPYLVHDAVKSASPCSPTDGRDDPYYAGDLPPWSPLLDPPRRKDAPPRWTLHVLSAIIDAAWFGPSTKKGKRRRAHQRSNRR